MSPAPSLPPATDPDPTSPPTVRAGVWTGPEHLDWTKITSLAPFDDLNLAGPYHQDYHKFGNNSDYADMFCKAHEHNARILSWGNQGWDGQACPVSEFYGWLLKKGEGQNPLIYNQSAVLGWARTTAACIPQRGFDGILLDIEGVHVPTKKEKAAITFAVCALKRELNKTLPGNLLAWTTDVGAYFDYKAMTEGGCVDLWLDMAYSWCVPQETHSATRNRANAPMPFLTGKGGIIDTYTNHFSVPVERLGILLPWYGCAWECAGEGSAYHGCPTATKRASDGHGEVTYGPLHDR